jgi:hypothetical protein
MEHAQGVSLEEKWPTMDVDAQLGCMDALYHKLKEMVDLKFQTYGSLYFANTPHIAASEPFDHENYCIGPHCGPMYWNCNGVQPKYYHRVEPDQGPCRC